MNHIFNKYDGRYEGSSVNAVDSDSVGHTSVAPPPELVNPTWNGDAWVEGEPEVPLRISRRQGKQQLVISGLDQQVEAIINGIQDPVQKKLIRIWYNDADYWELDNPELVGLAILMEIPDNELVELFKSASKL